MAANMYDQSNRFISLSIEGDTQLLMIENFSAQEALSQLFSIRVQAVSTDAAIDPNSIIGKSAKIILQSESIGERTFNGIITHINAGSISGANLRSYEVIIHPWMWYLTCRRNCKIFQQMDAIAIVSEIFQEHGFNDFDKSQVKSSLVKRDYCVQYNETDYDFVSRLLQEEGIFFYFEQKDGAHKLMLADSKSAYSKLIENEIQYDTGDLAADHISSWTRTGGVVSSKYAHTDYNFETPSTPLLTQKNTTLKMNKVDKLEDYQYAGSYMQKADGDAIALKRIEAHECGHDIIDGSSNCKSMFAGGSFKLAKHQFIAESGKEFVITAVTHFGSNSSYQNQQDGGEEYSNQFTCIPAETLYRPALVIEKPLMGGPQTALVVGPSGEEIYTDEYGRIKVQFHWDRLGKKNENSSCWIRVAQLWAGAKWGAQFIPRIGQEVVVNFINGDPDRPIVVGSVYNGEQMPTYDLPTNKTQSGIKTHSTQGGDSSTFNEIRFEDKKGEEELYLHAEKDNTFIVENDRSKAVGNDQAEDVGRNKTISVGANHTEQVGADMSLTVGANLVENIGATQSVTIGSTNSITVGAAMSVSVGLALTEQVGGTKSENIGMQKSEAIAGKKTTNVGGDYTIDVGGKRNIDVGEDLLEKIGGKQTTNIQKEYAVNAKKINFVAKDEISIKCGSAQITMKKNGDITIKGGKLNIKGSKDVIVKGSQVKEN